MTNAERVYDAIRFSSGPLLVKEIVEKVENKFGVMLSAVAVRRAMKELQSDNKAFYDGYNWFSK